MGEPTKVSREWVSFDDLARKSYDLSWWARKKKRQGHKRNREKGAFQTTNGVYKRRRFFRPRNAHVIIIRLLLRYSLSAIIEQKRLKEAGEQTKRRIIIATNVQGWFLKIKLRISSRRCVFLPSNLYRESVEAS
jgi:hypothetical protein